MSCKTVLIFAVIFLSVTCYAENITPPVIHLIGDSTMAIKAGEKRPETGWGEKLPQWVKEGVKVENYAVNGRSTKSFRDEGRWQTVIDVLKPGDYVVIQFGHNDQKEQDPTRYAAAWGEYRDNLKYYIEGVRAKAANPILATSVCRRRFSDSGEWQATHGDYPDVMRSVGREMKVPVIDMQASTRKMLELLGPEKSIGLFLHVPPGAYPGYPEGKNDDTHFNDAGATRVAGLFVLGVREQRLPLIQWLR